MAKISVIIPVFNCGDNIEFCVNSIINQTFSNIEIIIINDGSTDATHKKCLNLSLKDSRIRYFSQENQGLAQTRNFGLSVANSDYICFIDSDDYIETNALDFMYKNAVNTDCDILVCGYFLQKKLSIKKINCDDILIDNQNINKHLPMLKNLHLIDPVWNKMYKKSFLENSGVLMPKGEIFEDTFFNLTLLKFSPKIAVFNNCFYHYLTNIGSITRRYNPEKLDTLKSRATLLKSISIGIDSYCDYYYVKSIFSAFIDLFLVKKSSEILKEISTEIGSEEFKNAAKNADYNSFFAKSIIRIAKTFNTKIIFSFCKICFYFKYKI